MSSDGRPVVRNRLVAAAQVASALAVLAVAVALAVDHFSDRYQAGHVTGSWMALASALRDGTFYPELYGEDGFGGTRYMPVPILAHAAASVVTGEYLVSARLVALAAALALFVALFVTLRRRGSPVPTAVGLVGLVAATQTGTPALFAIRGDAASVALQLVAILAVLRLSTRSVVLAALLCSCALFTKTTALWGAFAIAVWLVGRDRRLAARFAGVYVGGVALLFGVFELASGGRFSDNVIGLTFAGTDEMSVREWVARFASFTIRDPGSAWPLLVLATVLAATALIRGASTPFPLATLAAAAILAVVMHDPGAYENHLLDLTVLSAVMVGELVVRLSRSGIARDARLATGIGVGVVVLTVVALPRTLLIDFRRGLDDRYTTEPLAGVVPAAASTLSEDPSLPVLDGRAPTILDPFVFLRLARRDPERVRWLLRDVESGRFDAVVLLFPADLQAGDGWYREVDLGPALIRAVNRGYRLRAHVATTTPQYWVYGRRQ